MAPLVLDHALILTPRLDRCRDFLIRIVGFHDAPRPPFGFPGHWLAGAGHAPIHLAAAGDCANDTYLGRHGASSSAVVDHLAFTGADRDTLIDRLRREGICFFERTVPPAGERQLFVEGPDGLKLEFLFR